MMATQNNPAARNTQKNLDMSSKVNVGSGHAPSIARNIEQPKIGKIGGGMDAMPGSKGKGQMVSTVPSNPITGPENAQPGNTSMGSGGTLPGFV